MKRVSGGLAGFSPSVGHWSNVHLGFVAAVAVTAVWLASAERESYGAPVTSRPLSASAAQGKDQGTLLRIPSTEANIVVALQPQS